MDDGQTWQDPKEITTSVKQQNWTWYATGPGSGIQMARGRHKGRLILGCDHIEAGTKKYYSHIIYSDDHGLNWQLGGSSPFDQVNECEVVQLSDGKLMLNMRNYDRTQKTRQVAYSADGGSNWYSQHHDSTLIEPICQASLHAHAKWIFFSNPSSSDARVNMTIKGSIDDAKSWSFRHQIHTGPSAYSDLVSLDYNHIGCLYERGTESAYEAIVFQRVTIDR
jgi:sialidase-1